MTELKFSEFALAPELHRGIADAGFTYCTPIQSKALPIALAGRDVAGQAQTGTGKTAAYLIALYHHLLTREPIDAGPPGPRALILAPTRELAVQIHKDATLLGAHLPYKVGLAFGGTDYEKQKRQLAEGVDVLIGTPGRLIDFFKQGIFGLRRVQVAVLDEADRMFDLGFLRDIRYILRRLPPAPQRLNLLFSATLSYRVLELAYEHMNDPELIRIEPDKLTVDRVRQVIYFPSNAEKLPLLVTLLREMDAKRTMVFVNTRRAAEHLQNALEHNGIHAAALSGDVPQRKRLKLMRDFQAGELPVLIATDVASRGLHVPDVSHVFNYDLPQDPEDYVHRVGRTARAGASGDAISFGCEDYVVSLPDIEEFIGRKIDVATFDHSKLVQVSVPPRPRRSERRDGAGAREPRARRGGTRRPERDERAGGTAEAEARVEQAEGRATEAEGTVDRRGARAARAEGRAADAVPGERATDDPRPERGGRRRRRARGRRGERRDADASSERSAGERDAQRARGPGKTADGGPRARSDAEPAAAGRDDAASGPAADRSASDEQPAQPKRRRRRRGRRGPPDAAGSADAAAADSREPNRSERPRRNDRPHRNDGEPHRGARDPRRDEREVAERSGRTDAERERQEPPRGEPGAERRPAGLLARLWTALRR